MGLQGHLDPSHGHSVGHFRHVGDHRDHLCRRDGSDGSGSSAGARRKRKEEIAQTFVIVNERPVDDISLDFFYKPHTITLLAVSVLAVMYFAFVR